MRSMSAGSRPTSSAASSSGPRRVVAREQVLGVRERQAPGLAGLADLVERVPAVAQPGDDPRVRRHRRGPPAVVAGDEPLVGPAPQGLRRDAGMAGDLGERQLLGHAAVRRSPQTRRCGYSASTISR